MTPKTRFPFAARALPRAWPVVALLAAAVLGPSPARGLTLEGIKARYKNVSHVEADVTQTKQSPQLKKPLRSEIRLTVDGTRMEWDVRKPSPGKVVIDGDRVDLGPLAPQGQQNIPVRIQRKVNLLVSFVKNLVAVDMDAIGKDFTTDFADPVLTLTPKAASPYKFMDRVALRFKPDADLDAITIHQGPETTEFSFASLVTRKTP